MEKPAPRRKPADPGNGLLKTVRRVIIFILGMSVLVVGLLMVVLPGPAMVVIPAGLGILATEFLWARRWLRYLQNRAREVVEWTVATTTGKPEDSAPESSAGASPKGELDGKGEPGGRREPGGKSEPGAERESDNNGEPDTKSDPDVDPKPNESLTNTRS